MRLGFNQVFRFPILAVLFLFFSAAPARAASSSSDNEVFKPSEEILYSPDTFFTATRSLKPVREVTDNVTVITREELDKWPVSDLDEALGMINGIVVQDAGDTGQTATAQIYGSKAREVRVLVDGITINPTTSGGIADLSQIPLEMVEKIEIIKGASSSVWGSALGGVINIITRPVGKTLVPHGNIQASYGEFDVQRYRGELWGNAGPAGYYGMGNYTNTGGYRPNGDELEKRGFVKGKLSVGERAEVFASFGYSGSKISEFDFPFSSQTNKRKVYSHYGNAGISFDWSEHHQGEFVYKLSHRDVRRDTRTFPGLVLARFTKSDSLIHEASYRSVWDITENQTVVAGTDIAVDIYRDAILTSNINAREEATRHAYYANYQLTFWRFDVTAGSRLDATNDYGVHFNPSLGTAFHLPFWDTILRGNVQKAFNAPSLVDRFLSAGTLVANPDLEAEKAIVYNLGMETSPASWLHGKAVFFQTFLRDSIQTVTRSDGLRQNVNIARERRTGFETDLEFGPWFGFTPSYGVTFVRAVDGSGVPLQSRPRLSQDLKLGYEKRLKGVHFLCHLAGRYTDLVKYSGFTDPMDQVFIFDGKMQLRFPTILYGQFSVFLLAENMFNEDFSFDGAHGSIPQRHFETGIKYGF